MKGLGTVVLLLATLSIGGVVIVKQMQATKLLDRGEVSAAEPMSEAPTSSAVDTPNAADPAPSTPAQSVSRQARNLEDQVRNDVNKALREGEEKREKMRRDLEP